MLGLGKRRRIVNRLPAWDLAPRQLQDVAVILEGTLAPLEGFLSQGDYDSVVRRGRLGNGTLWPVPFVLEVTGTFAAQLGIGTLVALRDQEGATVATLELQEIWSRNTDGGAGSVCLSGRLTEVERPVYFDFASCRLRLHDRIGSTAKQQKSIGVPVDRVLHRAEVEAIRHALKGRSDELLVIALDDREGFSPAGLATRVRCIQHVLEKISTRSVELLVSSVSSGSKDWRDILLKALVSQNLGCASCVILLQSMDQKAVYAQAPMGFQSWEELSKICREELSIELIAADIGLAIHKLGLEGPVLGEADLIAAIANESKIPEEYSFPEVISELRRTYFPKNRRGFTVFFTGLSGAGKSTLAKAFHAKLLETGGRSVSLLDGDVVRKHLSSELGFSREHRNLNVLRIGYVASEVTKHGGIAICAPIAPYEQTRAQVREMVSQHGGFVEVYVSTPLETCEARDRKGLYAKARAGAIKEFTGISDPYEPPDAAEVTIDTRTSTPEQAVQQIVMQIEAMGYSLR